MTNDREVLAMALIGYRARRAEIEAAIADIQSRLKHPEQDAPQAQEIRRRKSKKRKLSAEGRARILAALRKRWAVYHRQQKAAA